MILKEAISLGNLKIGNHETMLILSHLTGLDRGSIILNDANQLPNPNLFMEFLDRRLSGEPLQYILGTWEFMGYTFKTDARALIPRPETEQLVELATEFIKNEFAKKCKQDKPLRIMDLCTGTGCIAISIALLSASANISVEIIAVDKSAPALALARENAELLGVTDVVTFIESDLFNSVTQTDFHAIISNPPYIPSLDVLALDPVVQNHEPHMALDGGDDGLDFYRIIAPQAKKRLRPGGGLFLEIGPAQVADILKTTGFTDVKLINDYANLPRMVAGIKAEPH